MNVTSDVAKDTETNKKTTIARPGEYVPLNFKEILEENTNEFCTHSTLHGLKYIVDEHLYPLERIFFALSFGFVVLLSIFFISNVYTKWSLTPVIVTISPYPTYIINEPFPAITLCNLNQASRKRSEKYREDSSEYAMLQLLCKNEVNQEIAETIDWSLFENFIVNISQPCDEMLKICRYGSINYNCSDIFRSVVTDEGLCCTFNMINPKFMYLVNVSSLRNESYKDNATPVRWDPENGYPKDLPLNDFYPRVAAGTGETLGLSLTMDVDINDYYCSSSASIGVKLALHSPNEMPHVREIGTLLAAGLETKIRIRADKSEAAYNIKSMNKIHRQCYFEGESKLKYFSSYNKGNCEMECHARALLKYCQCLAHYMPMIEANARICGLSDTACTETVRQNKMNVMTGSQGMDCERTCWPSCFDLTFNSDYFSAPISHAGFHVSNEFVKNVSSEYASRNVIIAHFYFKENTYRSTRQTQFVGMTDFLSSIGGLMGLFMGFSFISVAECIYYVFLRPYHVLKRHERVHFHQHGSALSNITSAKIGGHYVHLTPSAARLQQQQEHQERKIKEQQQQLEQQKNGLRQAKRLNRIEEKKISNNEVKLPQYEGNMSKVQQWPQSIQWNLVEGNKDRQKRRQFNLNEYIKRNGYLP